MDAMEAAMAKLVGQDTSKSVTGFGSTSPGQSGKSLNTGSKASSTSQEFKSGYKSKGIGSSASFSRDGKGPSSLGDKFRQLAERRQKTKVKTTKSSQGSGKSDLNTVF
jgi:hypothetical protein